MSVLNIGVSMRLRSSFCVELRCYVDLIFKFLLVPHFRTQFINIMVIIRPLLQKCVVYIFIGIHNMNMKLQVKHTFDIQDYQVMNMIGKGGFACVYRARSTNTGQEVAIKMVSGQICDGFCFLNCL